MKRQSAGAACQDQTTAAHDLAMNKYISMPDLYRLHHIQPWPGAKPWLMHATVGMTADLRAIIGDMPDAGSSGLVELRAGPRAVVNAVIRAALDGPANTHCNKAFSLVSLMLSSLLLLSTSCFKHLRCQAWLFSLVHEGVVAC